MATTARSRTSKALDSDDAIAMRAAELAAWAQRNVRTILTAAVAVLAIFAVVFGLRYMNQRKADRAAAAWMETQAAAEQGAAGVARLTSFAAAHAGTPEASEARLAAATIFMRQNQPQQAVEQARRVVDAGGPFTYQALMTLGAAQAGAGQTAEAVQSYLRAAEETEMVFQRQEARSEAAQLHEQTGNWKAAAEVYRSMLPDTEEDSADRGVIELRVTEAEARAAGR